MVPVLHTNIEQITLNNTNYRQVIHTTKYNQVVLMSILPGDDIPLEKHDTVTQFIRIESGKGIAYIDNQEYELYDGISLNIPPGLYHKVVNTSVSEPLKLYSIYSPPEHPDGLIQYKNPNKKNRKEIKNKILLSLIL